MADVPAGHVRPRPRGRAAGRRHRLHPRPLAPVDGPVDGGRLAGLPGGRPVLDPLREDRGHGGRAARWCWPTAGWSTPRAPGRGRPPGPTSPSCSWAAKGTLGVITAARLRLHPLPAGRGAAGLRLRLLRRRARGLPPDPAPGRHPGRPAPLRPGRVRPELRASPTPACSSCSTRPTPACWRPPWRWWTRSAARRRPTAARRRRWSSGGCRTATTSRPWPRCGGPASWSTPSRWPGAGRPCRPGRRGRGRAAGHRRGPWWRRSTSPTPTPTGPASTSPSPVGARRRRRRPGARPATAADGLAGGLLPAGLGRRHRHGRPHAGRPSATTTASASTGRRFMAGALGRGLRRAGAPQGGPRPGRHPQPGQARAALALRAGGLAVSRSGGSLLVVDVGTSGVRAAVVRPDATVDHVHHRAGAARPPRRPAWSRSTPRRSAEAVARAGRGRPGRGRTGGRGGHRQPAGHHRGLGPGHRPAGGPGHRLAGPAHGRDLPGPPGRGDPPGPQRVGHQAGRHPRRRRPRPRGGPTGCASAPSTPGWPGPWRAGAGGGPPRHRRHQRRGHRPGPCRRLALGRRRPRARWASPPPCCPRIVDSSGAGRARPRPCPAPRRSAGSPATSRPRWSARAAPGPGWPRPPSAPAACSTCAPGRARPPTRRARRQRVRSPSWPGSGTGVPTWGVEAIMLSAGTCVEWLRDDLGRHRPRRGVGRRWPPGCDDTGDVWFVPALLGLGTPVWDFGARGTLLGVTRGTGRAELVRAVLEGVAHRGADLLEAAEADSGLGVGDPAGRRRHVGQRGVRRRPGRGRRPAGRGLAGAWRPPPSGRGSWPAWPSGTWGDEDDVAAASCPGHAVEPHGRRRPPGRPAGSAGWRPGSGPRAPSPSCRASRSDDGDRTADGDEPMHRRRPARPPQTATTGTRAAYVRRWPGPCTPTSAGRPRARPRRSPWPWWPPSRAATCSSRTCPGWARRCWPRTLAASLGAGLSRVQGHPDLLPTDVTGVSVYSQDTGTWEFRPGPVFAHVVLLDELNRTPPRTQSALLEAMEEQQVTVDGESWPLPRPHLVIATQNPIGQLGTYPLVESQLDRFALSTPLGYPDAADRDPARPAPRRPGGPGRPAGRCARPTTGAGPSPPPGRCAWRHQVAEYAVALCRATRQAAGGAARGQPPGLDHPGPLGPGPRPPLRPRLRVPGRRPGHGRAQPGPPSGDRRRAGRRRRRW